VSSVENLIIAVKDTGSRAEHSNTAFSMTTLYCNHRGYSFRKLVGGSIYVKHVHRHRHRLKFTFLRFSD